MELIEHFNLRSIKMYGRIYHYREGFLDDVGFYLIGAGLLGDFDETD